MKLYIVTETNKQDNLLLRSWVCSTKEQAKECLKKHYDIACTYNRIGGMADPIDCLEHGFFFWTLSDGSKLKYEIRETQTYAE